MSGLMRTTEARALAGGRRAFDHMVRLGLVCHVATKGRAKFWDSREVVEALALLPDARAKERAEVRRAAIKPCVARGCAERAAYRSGLCGPHHKKKYREENRVKLLEERANGQLRRGRAPSPAQSSPYRPLARTCRRCGTLNTVPDHLIRKESGAMPGCSNCSVAYATKYTKERSARDPEFSARVKAMQNAGRRRAHRKAQAESLEAASRQGFEWTGVELETLTRDDLTTREMARLLRRTYGATAMQRQRIRTDPRKARMAGLPDPEDAKET